jgi:phytanoyl-CoA hydroxylase
MLNRLRNLGSKQRVSNWNELTKCIPSLNTAEIHKFESDGFLVIPDLIDIVEARAIRKRLEDLAYGRVKPPSGVNFELEPAASSKSSNQSNGSPMFRQIYDIAPYDWLISKSFAFNSKVVAVTKSLLGSDIRLYRATAMLKPRFIGSDLPYHQDSAYWPIYPRSLVSCWMALDKATTDNGCMRVIPGAHKEGLMPVSDEYRDHVSIKKLSLTDDYLKKEIVLEMSPGSCLFFHSLLPHATGPNKSDSDRYAVIASYMSAHSTTLDGKIPQQYITVCGS